MLDDIALAAAEGIANVVMKNSARAAKTMKMRRNIKKAAAIINSGGLVAFPTETVYGLGADAFNADAVARIYATKGRPNDNPLILHISSLQQFLDLADNPPEYAIKLAAAYWPGPLTLVAKKRSHLPKWLGGHPNNTTDTVGIRIPNHPAALALIQAAGCPIAAPSANKAGRPSPTTATHVKEDYPNKEIDMVLEGEALDIGVESTVVDITGQAPVILRPGAITAEMIESIVATAPNANSQVAPRSPGTKYRHYAPKAPMYILNGTTQAIASHIIVECDAKSEEIIGALVTKDVAELVKKQTPPNVHILILGDNPNNQAQELYAHLRSFDKTDATIIYSQSVPNEGLGTAIMDRMLKAADGNVLEVM